MNNSSITTIISGGQTGADRGALDAALKEGVKTAGFVPKGRLAEDGQVDTKYNLKEMPTKSYPPRTRANVRLADFSAIFTNGEITGGSLLTKNFCLRLGKPYLHIDVSLFNSSTNRLDVMRTLDHQIRHSDAKSLNIAGTRESQSPGLEKEVYDFLVEFFNQNFA